VTGTGFEGADGADEETDCVACAVGKYSTSVGTDTGDDCTDCMVGKYLDVTASDAPEDCIACIPGKYIDVEGSDEEGDCIGCDAGWFQPDEATTLCIICPTGKHQNATAEPFCYDCVVGKSGPTPGALECVGCGNGKYQDETGFADCKDLDQCTQTYVSASEAGVLEANPCGQLGDLDAVCIDASAPLTGNNCSCSDERVWESLYSNLDPGVGQAVCNQMSLLVKSAMQINGAISAEGFVQGMTEAIQGQIDADANFAADQAAAQENAVAPADPDSDQVEVRVTSYETTVTSAAVLPGTAADFAAGDPTATPPTEPTPMYTSLVYGLTTAACGNLTSTMCSVSQVDIARRRRAQDAASTVTVSFVVTAAVDISDNVAEGTFAGAFVEALANEPDGALTTVTLEQVSIEEPVIDTAITYIVVSSDTAVSTMAARTMGNDAAVQASLSKYATVPITGFTTQCSNCDAIIEVNTATPMIMYVILFFVLLSIVWGVGILVYGRQTGAATMIQKVEAVAGAVSNPMFMAAEAAGDVVEGVTDVSTKVVTETVDATAVKAVKKTGKTAKKGGKKAAKKAVAVANPMYDDDDDD
jgi:hypothetical protein